MAYALFTPGAVATEVVDALFYGYEDSNHQKQKIKYSSTQYIRLRWLLPGTKINGKTIEKKLVFGQKILFSNLVENPSS
jgi:hypothetical protein